MQLVVDANGAVIPAIGLGTWELRGRACARLVEQALRLGYRHIDTAQIYENEREVGDGLRASGVKRDSVFVTTKVWTTHFAPHDLERSTKESLSKLHLAEVDLLLLHWPTRGCRWRRRWGRWRMSNNSAWRGTSASPISPWP
jgi:2,5-diketo-D-gluconate reductase B